jgi:hypothetical protein
MPCSRRNSDALEALGQLLTDGLLDDAWTGKPDERMWLGDVEVAEHREAGGDAARGRVGEHGDVGRRLRSSRASAALTLAICMSENVPSIMRAPPEQDTTTTGRLCSRPRSMARVIFSPTTTPMLPPMKLYSMAATSVVMPSIVPVPHSTASLKPSSIVRHAAAASRAWCR